MKERLYVEVKMKEHVTAREREKGMIVRVNREGEGVGGSHRWSGS